jgi:hypothetical protein
MLMLQVLISEEFNEDIPEQEEAVATLFSS